MAKKALVVRFRNAALFTDPTRSSDRMISGRDRTDRGKAPRVNFPEDTLDVRHVANMLHVLMGERPVPSFRASAAKPDLAILAMAREARVQIAMWGVEETKTVRKAVKDAWNTVTLRYHLNDKDVMVKGGLLYHDRLERFLGKELYVTFLETVRTVTGTSDPRTTIPAHSAIEILNANGHRPEVVAFAKACVDHERTALANLVKIGGNTASITFHQGTGSKLNILVVNKAVEKVRRVSGTIYVPLSGDGELARIRQGTGVATLLEGGFVSIQRIDDWTEELIHGTKQVVEGSVHVPDKN